MINNNKNYIEITDKLKNKVNENTNLTDTEQVFINNGIDKIFELVKKLDKTLETMYYKKRDGKIDEKVYVNTMVDIITWARLALVSLNQLAEDYNTEKYYDGDALSIPAEDLRQMSETIEEQYKEVEFKIIEIAERMFRDE